MRKRYVPITQQPFCCVPANIQMVLLRRELSLLSQEEIGYELGLTVPEDYYELLPNARRGEKPSSGWGTQIQKEEFSLNTFFTKYHYPLIYQFYSPQTIKESKEWVKQQIAADNDLIVCFNYFHLYRAGNNGGHVCLIDSVEGDNVILVEPERDFPKYRTVKLSTLIDAMNFHGEVNLGGFWLIRDKSSY